ncbi:MAG: protein-disulfide reductase DsbD family protein [Acidobacteriota bacterium]|nr:protein-disulfide reductase DsbD family protein [Blastocatellia bacterium]MDW8239311.1 protein-disulfide reductase DsbD family protein [Acidobacteriota bacterium]
MKLWITFVVLCLLALPCSGSTDKGAVQAELLADVAAIQPGKSFTVGVLLRMKPGWHVYWKNPGDSGLPTLVEFKVPQGFVLGPLQWPIPTRFDQPGNIVGYGYSDSVLFIAKVLAPKTVSLGSTIRIQAKVEWLSCEQVCIPGKANLSLTLPVSKAAAPANAELFASWQRRLPQESTGADSPLMVRTSGSIPPNGTAGSFLLSIQWKSAPLHVEWYPTADEALVIEDVTCQTQATQTQVSFKVAILPGQRLSSTVLESLVVYTDTDGVRKGVIVPVRLRG